jgi:hypothetical protein
VIGSGEGNNESSHCEWRIASWHGGKRKERKGTRFQVPRCTIEANTTSVSHIANVLDTWKTLLERVEKALTEFNSGAVRALLKKALGDMNSRTNAASGGVRAPKST